PAHMRSSMQKDFEQNRQLELDAIGGPILRAARRHGLKTSVTQKLMAEIEEKLTARQTQDRHVSSSNQSRRTSETVADEPSLCRAFRRYQQRRASPREGTLARQRCLSRSARARQCSRFHFHRAYAAGSARE